MDRMQWSKRFAYALGLTKWIAVASAIGCACGAVGAIFHKCVDASAAAFSRGETLLFFLPAAGLVIVTLYRMCRLPVSIGTDRVFESTRSKEGVPAAIVPLIFVGTVLTHLFGGSSGREGAALQLGGGIACLGGRLLKMKEREMHTAEMCGMSALFSALFGTPMAASFFVMEVVDVGVIHYQSLFPCVLSSISAYLVASHLGVHAERFLLPSGAVEIEALPMLRVLLLAALCGVIAILFCKAMHVSGKLLKKLMPNDYARAFVGGACVVAITLLLGTRDYNGAGMHVIERAISGEAEYEAWAVKLLLTCLTLGAGFRGGEIVPSFFVGATFGCIAGGMIGLDPSVSAALGMISVFCGVTNTPAASMLIALEMFGSEYLLPFGLAVGVSFLVSGRCSLYHSQHFLEAKYAWGKEG